MQSRIASIDRARPLSGNSMTEASTKPAPRQHISAFRWVAEPEDRRGRRQRYLRVAVFLKALQHNREKIMPVGPRQDRECKPPIWTEHPIRLCAAASAGTR